MKYLDQTNLTWRLQRPIRARSELCKICRGCQSKCKLLIWLGLITIMSINIKTIGLKCLTSFNCFDGPLRNCTLIFTYMIAYMMVIMHFQNFNRRLTHAATDSLGLQSGRTTLDGTVKSFVTFNCSASFSDSL